MSSDTKDKNKISKNDPGSERAGSSLSITNKTKKNIPNINFKEIKEFVLGKEYDLSLVFVGNKTSRKLNSTLRGKDRPTNILSFPLSKTDGEIFMNPSAIEKENKKNGENYKKYFAYILIHGLTHLKGFDHGSKMEGEESRIMKKFLNTF